MATQSVTVFSLERDTEAAGRDLAMQVIDAFGADPPHAAVLFVSARYDHPTLLRAFADGCRPEVMVGSCSSGEFTGAERAEGAACALALRSDEVSFAAGLGRGVGSDRAAAARELVSSFRGLEADAHRYRAALVLTDALAGHADDLVSELTDVTSGSYQFAGGGAGDDGQFRRTPVFFGTDCYTDAAVGLEMLSERPIGVGVAHGWVPASPAMRVTEAAGLRLVSLDGLPAMQAFEAHAEAHGKRLDRSDPLPFFLHNVLGVDTGSGHLLRVPLAVEADGALLCAAEVSQGARVHIMRTSAGSAIAAAASATDAALRGLRGAKPGAAFLFDCVATRLRIGEGFGAEVSKVAELIGQADLVGCNTHGQVARTAGQFNGFHNCTAVVLTIPR